MKEVYGTNEYNKRNKYDWEALAEKCRYVVTPEQGANECGYYVMRMASLFDGEKYVVPLKNKDVSVSIVFLHKVVSLPHFLVCYLNYFL